MPRNTDVTKVLELQRIKDKAIRKRMEMDCLNRERGVNELEDEIHGLKTTSGLEGFWQKRQSWFLEPKTLENRGCEPEYLGCAMFSCNRWQCCRRKCKPELASWRLHAGWSAGPLGPLVRWSAGAPQNFWLTLTGKSSTKAAADVVNGTVFEGGGRPSITLEGFVS
eukprot:6481564-Amphidinium_carterae.2